MPETRTFEPGKGNGIQQQVRAALGENVRPVHPSQRSAAAGDSDESAEADTRVSDIAKTAGGAFLFYDGGTATRNL